MASTHFPCPSQSPIAEPLKWFVVLIGLFIVLPAGFIFLTGPEILSGLAILASLRMMQRSVGIFNLRQITIPAFFYYIYFAVILVPGFFIFADEITPSRWRFLMGIESVLITVPAGIILANQLLKFRPPRIAEYFRRPLEEKTGNRSQVRLFALFLLLAAVVVAINIKETNVIPLLYLIRNPGEFFTAAVLREDSFKLLNSHLTYVYSVLRGSVFPFLILVAYGCSCFHHSRIWRRLFWLSLALGIFYASLTIEKSPVAAIFGLLFLFYYLFRGGRVGRMASIGAPVLFLCFPLAVILLAYHGSESGTLGAAIRAIGLRVFYSPAQIVYNYFEIFPAVIPFQHGASITKLAELLGWRTIDIPNAVGLYMTTGTDLDTITANSCFIGNMNADFGLVGVVFGGMAAGFLMQAASIHFCRGRKTVVQIAAHALCMWAFGLLVTTALPTVLLSGGVAFALVLAWIFDRLPKRSPAADVASLPAFSGGPQ